MPATVFNPLAAVIVHSLVDVDPLTFAMLEAEDALLIHACRRQATRQEWRRYNKDGKLIVFVRHSPVLTYSISATALDPTGENLGNYHPGRCLSDRALAFINGGRTPYQFEGAVEGIFPGKLILKDPSQEPGAGDATEVDFMIEHAFVDLDEANYPGSLTVIYEDLTTQTARTITAAAMGAILSDLFCNTELVTGTLSAILYNGDPAGDGAALGSTTSAAWASTSEPGAADTTHDACPEIIVGGGPSGRSITHIRVQRPALVCVDIPLGATLTVPAWTYVRANAADLIAKLTWDFGGLSTARPARLALRYLLGDLTTGISAVAVVLTINCYDDDPEDGGTLLDSFTADRDATTWALPVDGQVENAIALTGTNLAPPGGWLTTYVTVELAGITELLNANFLSGTIATAEGDPITIPAGGLSQVLA